MVKSVINLLIFPMNIQECKNNGIFILDSLYFFMFEFIWNKEKGMHLKEKNIHVVG